MGEMVNQTAEVLYKTILKSACLMLIFCVHSDIFETGFFFFRYLSNVRRIVIIATAITLIMLDIFIYYFLLFNFKFDTTRLILKCCITFF